MDPCVDPFISAERYPHVANKSSNQIDIWVMGVGRNWFSAASKSRPCVRNETTMGWRGRVKTEIDFLWGFMRLFFTLDTSNLEMRRDTVTPYESFISSLPLLHEREDPWILMRPTAELKVLANLFRRVSWIFWDVYTYVHTNCRSVNLYTQKWRAEDRILSRFLFFLLNKLNFNCYLVDKDY